MKKILIALMICSMLMMYGCSTNSSENTPSDPAPSEQSSEQESSDAASETDDKTASEKEEDSDDTAASSEKEEDTDNTAASSEEGKDTGSTEKQDNAVSTLSVVNDSLVYTNNELGFSMQLPSCIEDKVKITTDSRDANGETVSIIHFTYQGENGEANILTLEEMSSKAWEDMQKQNGPIPAELGTSENGRVVVMYPLQSNPYELGTADADVIDQFAKEDSIITNSFSFVNGSFEYENKELGFSMKLPSCIEDKVKITTDSRDANGETVNVIYFTYQGEGNEANILMLEEMSSKTWEAMKKENGPLPVELGTSEDGRVVVMYPLQSNPYEMGTADAAVIDQFAKEDSVITDSFSFLKN